MGDAGSGAVAPKPQQAANSDEAAAIRSTYRRLWATPVDNRRRCLGWRLSHGQMPCGTFQARFDGQPSGVHLCAYACCAPAHARQQAPSASLTHLFIECPHYQPARDWLADTWHAVTGQRPPMTAALLLGDQQAAWAAYPEGSTAQLWNALRLSWLFALWTTHSRADPSERHAHAVVAATVSSMITTIRSVFCRCLPGPLIFHVLPPNILTRQLKEQELSDFTMVWARNNVLCQVEQDGAGIKHLRVWLSMLHPVPAPLPPPPPVRAAVQMQQ